MIIFKSKAYIATIAYIMMIVLLNCAVVYLPGVAAFGQHFSIADLFVGSIYLVRDFAQREIKHYIFAAMLIGTILSYLLADPAIALASVSAFCVGEVFDWAIFTFTRKPLSQRLILSATVSAPIDGLVFLGIAHRLGSIEWLMMTVGKIIGVFLIWMVWKLKVRRKLHQNQNHSFSINS